MAGYNEIRGLEVKYLSADPANPENGQVWYNSTTGKLRAAGINVPASWASGGNLGTARYQLGGAGNAVTAGLAFGGYTNTGTGYANTEEYDGSSWTGGGALPVQKRGMANAGTQTAALSGGGFRGPPSPYVVSTTEEYDGSSWTGGGALNTARGFLGGCGLQTAGLAIGGANDTPAWVEDVTNVESYNGSSWTNGTALPVGQRGNRAVGTTTACLNVGGLASPGPGVQVSLEYDGSSWTSAGNISTTRYGGGASGIQTSALNFGGSTPPGPYSDATERYDGTSWTADVALPAAQMNQASTISSPSSSVLSFGGGAPASNVTVEYTGETTAVKNLTTS